MTGGEQRYIAGYNQGRTLAIQSGSSEAGRIWLNEHPHSDPAYIAGYEWALFDYDDANGLPGRRGISRDIG